jgi:hypothetical protein
MSVVIIANKLSDSIGWTVFRHLQEPPRSELLEDHRRRAYRPGRCLERAMGRAGHRARSRDIRLLRSLACDVLCVTEVALGLLVPTGHVIDSEADYGYFASVIDAKSSSGADDRGRPSTE